MKVRESIDGWSEASFETAFLIEGWGGISATEEFWSIKSGDGNE